MGATLTFNVAPHDTYSLDEVPNSVPGFLRQNVCASMIGEHLMRHANHLSQSRTSCIAKLICSLSTFRKNTNFKLAASQHRILGTHFTAAASKHALSVVNIAESFKKHGYIWPTSNGSCIDLRELPGYQCDANDALIWFRPKRVLESQNANEHRPAKEQAQA